MSTATKYPVCRCPTSRSIQSQEGALALSRRQLLMGMGLAALPLLAPGRALNFPVLSVLAQASPNPRQYYRLTLEQLYCSQTEDYVGHDECRLEVYADGVLQPALKKRMNDGDIWQVDCAYLMEQSAIIKLWDEDPEGDDLLGVTTISAQPQDVATVQFRRDGARYRLIFRVVLDAESNADPVSEAMTAFSASSEPGVWPHLSKTALLADMQSIIQNPLHVQQGPTPFCGPAAVVYELVSRFPIRYIKICRNLFEKGRFYGRTKHIAPSRTLRQSPVRAGVSPANWMLLASLRDFENLFLDVDDDAGDLAAGVSTPGEMEIWIKELLGFDTIEYESTYFYGEFDALRKAKRVRERDGVAFLMIDSALLHNDDPAVGIPNHWVSFTGNLAIDSGSWWQWDSGHIHFDCFSWGGILTVDAGEGLFEDCFWGVVTGLV